MFTDIHGKESSPRIMSALTVLSHNGGADHGKPMACSGADSSSESDDFGPTSVWDGYGAEQGKPDWWIPVYFLHIENDMRHFGCHTQSSSEGLGYAITSPKQLNGVSMFEHKLNINKNRFV
ncbi:hypothetical protein FOL47_011084, partial [Perkinsus chesapeaki]